MYAYIDYDSISQSFYKNKHTKAHKDDSVHK
jgi:hypothetical protein